jgi:hypothetical protein
MASPAPRATKGNSVEVAETPGQQIDAPLTICVRVLAFSCVWPDSVSVIVPRLHPSGLGANLAPSSDAPSILAILAGEEYQCFSDGSALPGWGSHVVNGHSGSLATSTAHGSPRGARREPASAVSVSLAVISRAVFRYHQTVSRSGISQSPYPLEASTFRGRWSMRRAVLGSL